MSKGLFFLWYSLQSKWSLSKGTKDNHVFVEYWEVNNRAMVTANDVVIQHSTMIRCMHTGKNMFMPSSFGSFNNIVSSADANVSTHRQSGCCILDVWQRPSIFNLYNSAHVYINTTRFRLKLDHDRPYDRPSCTKSVASESGYDCGYKDMIVQNWRWSWYESWRRSYNRGGRPNPIQILNSCPLQYKV